MSDSEMTTNIANIGDRKTSVEGIVKLAEDQIDNMENTDKRRNDTTVNQEYYYKQNMIQQKPETKTKKSTINWIMSKLKSPVVIALLFTLFAHPTINDFVTTYVKYPTVSLLLRGIILGVLIMLINKYL